MDPTAVVLGLLDGTPFPEATVRLGKGARLLLRADGVTEAANSADEELREQRLERLIGEKGDAPPIRLIEAIVDAVTSFCGKAKPADDATMMVVSRGKEVAGLASS